MNKIINSVANATDSQPVPKFEPTRGGLADRARPNNDRSPPCAVRGGTSLQSPENGNFPAKIQDVNKPGNLKIDPTTGDFRPTVQRSTPPLSPAARLRVGKVTDVRTAEFLKKHARLDWLAATIPHRSTGKGLNEGTEEERLEENDRATEIICDFAAAHDLTELRLGRGTDGFAAGMDLIRYKMGEERDMTIRTGHSRNMPGFEITGGSESHVLSMRAVKMMGRLLVSRVDVCMDISKNGYFEFLLELAHKIAESDKLGRMAPPRLHENGRCFWIGGSAKKGAGKPEAEICVYKKGFEQLERGKILPEDCDANWVRIEGRFRPQKEKKVGIARVIKEQGPWALFGSARWVRSFTEQAIEKLGVTDESVIAVTRLSNRPDPRRDRDKAEAGLRQYARRFVRAAVVDLVEERFDGDFSIAEGISAIEVIDRVRRMNSDYVDRYLLEENHKLVQEFIDSRGLDKIRCDESRSRRLQDRLDSYLISQAWEFERAQSLIKRQFKDGSDYRQKMMSSKIAKVA